MCYIKKKHPNCCDLAKSEILCFWCIALTFLYKEPSWIQVQNSSFFDIVSSLCDSCFVIDIPANVQNDKNHVPFP